MGQTQTVICPQLEIAAPPEEVRAVLLDFEKWNEWHHAWAASTIKPDQPPVDLKVGEKIKVNLDGPVIYPTIVENSPRSLQWRGAIPIPGLFAGVHQFFFEPSKATPGHTTLTQIEDFTGLLTFFLRPGSGLRASVQKSYEQFNNDLKVGVEQRKDRARL